MQVLTHSTIPTPRLTTTILIFFIFFFYMGHLGEIMKNQGVKPIPCM